MTRTEAIQAPTARPLRDVRGFWRVLLAIVAPIPMLAKGVYYLVAPVPGGADVDTTYRAYLEQPALAELMRVLDVVFVGLLIPAVFAVIWAARRGAPRLTSAGAFVTLVGGLAGVGLLGGVTTPAYLAAVKGADLDAVRAVDGVIENDPLFLVAGLLFVIAIVIGLSLLGAALWRSRVAPAAFGVALIIGGATHPFLPGPMLQGIGLLVAAVGFAGASLALLRTPNDEFDLPPHRA